MNKQKRTRARGEFNYVVLYYIWDGGRRQRTELGYLVSDPPLSGGCCSKEDTLPVLMRMMTMRTALLVAGIYRSGLR